MHHVMDHVVHIAHACVMQKMRQHTAYSGKAQNEAQNSTFRRLAEFLARTQSQVDELTSSWTRRTHTDSTEYILLSQHALRHVRT
jgi:diphthamide synthase subunit DPH2